MGRRTRIHNINRTAENDIRYRGPLSYRHLLIMGWLAIVFMVIGIWTSLGISLDPKSPDWMFTINRISKSIGNYALPLLLFSNFCIILDEKKAYKDLLIKNGVLTLAMVAAYMLLIGRYLTGIVNMFTDDIEKTNAIIIALLREGTRTGDLAFNLFIDLLLCTLFMCFLNYVPKKGFFAKHLLAFRWLAVIPIIYETGSLAIRILSASGRITPSFYIYPFLTTKAPMSFVMFVALCLYIKVRERIFLRNGKTLQDYKEFLKTNANSWQFSVYASLILVVTCVIDMLLLIVFVTHVSTTTIMYAYSDDAYAQAQESLNIILDEIGLSSLTEGLDEETVNYIYGIDEDTAKYIEGLDEETLKSLEELDKAVVKEAVENEIFQQTEAESKAIEKETMSDDPELAAAQEQLDQELSTFELVKDIVIADSGKVVYAWGFGKHIPLIVLLPFILLLSYTRVYKNKKIDAMIPPAGVLLAVLVSVECMYQGISMFLPNLLKVFK